MIKAAQLYKNELGVLFAKIWYDEKYKYWNCGSWYGNPDIEESSRDEHQFVSINSAGEVIGYIAYWIERETDRVYGLSIINFTDDIVTFGLDIRQALDDIFMRFGFRKLCFSVVVGNPIEKNYDRLVKRYGGRIVGIEKEEVKLIDGKLYDHKKYEIFRREYIENRR